MRRDILALRPVVVDVALEAARLRMLWPGCMARLAGFNPRQQLGWLGPHTTRSWVHGKSVALGMHNARDVIHRTEKCLECHLGTKNKFVDHEMVAAGHPDLYFELDSFSAVMPRHCKSPRESEPDKPVEDAMSVGVRAGQAVQLRAAMAMDSLYIAHSRGTNPANAAEVRAAINGLFQRLENPSSYNADQFASALRRIRTVLQ